VRSLKSLLIVYHSMTGGTLQMADAAAAGARRDAALHVRLMRAPDTHAQDVLPADGFIFATPENLGSMSGMMKDFFDRTYYAALEQLNGRPYAVLVCAGSDGRGAAQQIERIALGWRLKQVADPYIVCTHAQSPEQILKPKTIEPASLDRCEELGALLAAGLAMGVF
jgi:multimeric flavodoxin WrbA